MRHKKLCFAAVLAALALLLTAFSPLAAAIGDPGVRQTALPASDGRDTRLMDDDDVEREVIPMSEADNVFSAKFEGDAVEGTASNQDGKYVIEAVKTDGEAWHIKLECNYETVPGRDYFVTYQFRSTTAGLVKFGDQQEFRIVRGDNAVTGILTAVSDLTYLDLQLGALAPFTAEFTGVIVEELEDVAEFEEIMAPSFRLDADGTAAEQHDEGYDQALAVTEDEAVLQVSEVPQNGEVWQSKLFINTGAIPEAGNRYRISAEVEASNDMDFEILYNNGDREKGYTARYGLHLEADTPKTVRQTVAVPIEGFEPEELVLQFALGRAPKGTDVKVRELHVEKITDGYTSVLPTNFALTNYVWNGTTYTTYTAVDSVRIPLTAFSYEGTDSVFERHDDDYQVRLEETESSATLAIEKAPENDRGVWKAKLYAATGLTLEAGTTYRICFDLASLRDQANYEACFDGDYENAYGALYGRSLTAGGTDHVEFIVTPDVSHGPLTLRLQLGETDSAAGNTVTLSNLSVEQLTPRYQPVGEVSLHAGSTGNVREEHSDGVAQTLTVSDGAASLNVTAARSEGGVWSSKLLIQTGVTPEAGARFRVSAALEATADTGEYELLYQNAGAEALYGGLWGLTGPGSLSSEFTAPSDGCGELVLVFQLGNLPADCTVTVREIRVQQLSDGSMTEIELPDFAYPVSGVDTLVNNSFFLEANNGAEAELRGDGSSATALVTVPGDDWNVKLYARPELQLEAGQTYTVSMDVTGAAGCTACYKNTDTGNEEGFGTEPIVDGTVTHTIVPAENGTLEILLKIGSVSENTEVTVKNIQIRKAGTGSDASPIAMPGFAYPVSSGGTTTNNSFLLEANEGAEAVMTGNGTSATATVTTHGDDWHVKFYALTGVALEAGQTYRISMDVTGASGCTACYKNTATGAEDGFGTEAIGSGTVVHTVTPTEDGTLEILLKIGNVADGTAVRVSNVRVEKSTASATNVMPSAITYPDSFFLESNSGALAELSGSGSSATATIVTPVADWNVKFYVKPHAVLEAGKTYQISLHVTNASGCPVCFKDLGTGNEEGFGTVWLSSNDQTVTHTVTPSSNGEMEILLKIGNLTADTAVTVSDVRVDELTTAFAEMELSGFAYPVTTPETTAKNSFDLETNEGAAAAMTGDGSSATATVTTPGDDWHVKFYAKPGVELEAGKQYRISMGVTGANGCQVCFKRVGGEETDFGTETVSSETVTHTVTPTESGTLEILLKIGNVPAGTAVTVRDIQIEEIGAEEIDVLPSAFAYPTLAAGGTEYNSFDLEANNGAAAALTGDGSSAEATVTTPGDDWHIKLYAKPGVELEAGSTYQIDLNITGAEGCQVCYKRVGGEETDFGTETVSSQTVTHTVTPTESGTLEILVKLGTVPAGTVVKVSDITISKRGGGTPGDNLMTDPLTADASGAVNFWAHEDYAASLSGDDGAVSLSIDSVPEEGREAWKIKLFVETGLRLTAGTHYRISADVSASAELDYEICYNDGAAEKGLGALYGLHAAADSQTAVYEATPESDTDLILQFNLGWADGPCTVTVANVRVEEMAEAEGEPMLESFRYDSVGSFSSAADDGYLVSLEKEAEAATFRILQAPAVRNPWNVKLFVQTGFTPEPGKNYRITYDLEAARPQSTFETSFDGNTEAAYGMQSQALKSGKQTVTGIIQGGKGPLTIQIRPGKTNGTDGNVYRVSNVKIEAVTLVAKNHYNYAPAVTLWTHEDYKSALTKQEDRAEVRIEQTPDEGMEPWKTKLFIDTGVTLKAGEKYRISLDVCAEEETAFEICYNRGGEEKGLGAQYGLTAYTDTRTYEYTAYAIRNTHLVIQVSLGSCEAPNSFTVSRVKVEKAGALEKLSEREYDFEQ